jgi:four helix bundle protein
MSRRDFTKSLCISIKELNETIFWLRLIGRREWIAQARLTELLEESVQIKRILGAIVARSRQTIPQTRTIPEAQL